MTHDNCVWIILQQNASLGNGNEGGAECPVIIISPLFAASAAGRGKDRHVIGTDPLWMAFS